MDDEAYLQAAARRGDVSAVAVPASFAGHTDPLEQSPHWRAEMLARKGREDAARDASTKAEKEAAEQAKFEALPIWKQKVVLKARALKNGMSTMMRRKNSKKKLSKEQLQQVRAVVARNSCAAPPCCTLPCPAFGCFALHSLPRHQHAQVLATSTRAYRGLRSPLACPTPPPQRPTNAYSRVFNLFHASRVTSLISSRPKQPSR